MLNGIITIYGIGVLGPCEVEEPHPQPPPRKRGACSDVPYMIRKRYITDDLFKIGYHSCDILDESCRNYYSGIDCSNFFPF